MRPPASPREPPQAPSHPSGPPPTPGAAPETSRPVSPLPDTSPQTDRQTDRQPAAIPPQPVKNEQRDDVMAAQLRREQARTREQESRIDHLQQQLDTMKSIILRMQQPPSPSSSSDSEPDDGGGYTDDENNSSSHASRPASPIPPPRRNGSQTSSQSSFNPYDSYAQPPHPPSVIPPPLPKSTNRASVAPALRPPSSSAATRSPRAQSTTQSTPERFAKADLSRLSTALEPSKVQRWVNDLLETIEDYSPDAAWLLALPAPSARLALAQHQHLRQLDRWAARQAINTMQTDKPYVRLLLNASTAEAIAARTSGIELLVYVHDRAAYCSGETARVRVAQFDAKSYFDTQMDAATTHLQADELRNDFLALPAERTAAPNGLLRALLKKLPASVALPRVMLEDKLTEVEALGVHPPWTFDQLVNVVAQHILVAASRAEVAAVGGVQIHTIEARGKRGPDPGLRPDQMKCPCCGQQGHRPRDCPTTCKVCKQRSCPGNYGAACIVFGKTFPASVLNASGRPVPPSIKAILQKAHDKKAGQSQSKKFANVLEATAISTDNPHLWDVMTSEEGKTSNMLIAAASTPEAPASVAIDGVKEVCPTFKTADGRVRSTPRLIMIDGGSNINLFNNKAVPSLGVPLPGAPVQVSGWSDSVAQSVVANYRVDLQLQLVDGTMKRVTIEVAYSDQGRRDILSESLMWDMHSWSVLKEPAMRIDTHHGSVPLVRLNGIYFVEALLLPPRSTRTSALEANVLSAKRHGALHLARLWAARLHAGSAVLRRQLPACSGLGIEEMTPAMAKVADQDILNKRSNARRTQAVRSSSAPTEPGELFIFDAYGPVAAQSVIDGSHYEFEAVCASTGYGYEAATSSLTQDQWLSFIAAVLANERALGHVVRRIRFDRVPNLHAASFQQAVHLQFQVAIEFAARHEGVGAAEQRNDQKQRIAEADLMRAERTQSYLLAARVYAGWRINRRVAEGSTKTRFELHTGKMPDLADPVPYLFGIACSVLEDESERGPKGAGCSSDSLHKGRTSAGVFVGIRGYSYVVRLNRGVVVERRHITPHDEHVLLLRGVPSSAVMVDASTSTTLDATQTALVVAMRSSPQPQQAQTPHDGPPSARTRQKRAVEATVSLVEAHLDAASLAALPSVFDDALFQFRPDMYDVCFGLALDEARTLLSQSPPVDHQKEMECCKATADVVQVQTDVGIQEYRVPATHLARERAPDALEWRRADDAALQVLLNTPSRDGRRNVLVPVSKPASLGQPVIPSVLQRRIKTDPVTRKLIKRKSRLCAAGDRQKVIQQNTGTYQPRQTHADAADDLLIKFVLAASAGTPTRPPMCRLKLDIGNAYGRGIRRRPPAYMSLGKSLARVSDSGEELCLELHTPTYGEEPSGDEWGDTFHVDIKSTGWQTAEAVPALYYFSLPDDQGRAFFIRIVDDVLITFPSSCRFVAENTITRFKEYYHNDVSVEWNPTSFVGYALIDDPGTGAITLNMASHVEHAVRQHLPGLLASPPVRPSAALKKGQSFQSLADSLRHSPAARPLDESQTRVQRMVGAMRYPEKVLPVLTLGLHRLSCVAQNPPPAASLVADLLLEIAFDHRFEGLTYGGCSDAEAAGLQLVSAFGVDEADRPPDKLIAYGDATWTAGLREDVSHSPSPSTDAEGREVASRDLYSVVLTFRGAAVLHQTKKLALLVDCSMAAEEVATSKAAEYVEYAAQIARALGVADEDPVAIGTDNVANRQVAMRQGAASRSKHLLRRYWVLMQRVQAGEVRVVHVKDEANPADFLTKWVSAKKLRASVAYVSGQSARRQGFVKDEIMKRRLSGA